METIGHTPQFLLASIIPQKVTDDELLNDLEELQSLVDAYGGVVKGLLVQRREVHSKGMYIGRGKIEELARMVEDKKIDVVVLNAKVNPGQIFEIKRQVEKVNPHIQVWDRVDLILQIFDKHAHSSEAKLQIELAKMKHMGPRIYGMGYVLSQQGGGVGTRGIGETNTELMKRHWSAQMKKVKDKIKKHSQDRERQLERRVRNGVHTVSIIGYTNAGKTSLFNILTGKKNSVQNALFVTLDSSTGKVFLPESKKEILLTDTIGFIKNLPTTLIDAFRSTLMESIHADLLLVVSDISDSKIHKKIDVVEDILNDLGLYEKKRMYVFNKIDLVDTNTVEKINHIYKKYTPQSISVKDEKGISELLQKIEESLQDNNSSSQPRKIKIIHAE